MSIALPTVVRPIARGATRTAPVPAMVLAAWAALFVNVLGWADSATLLPIQHTAGHTIAQAALPLAVLFALVANRTLVVRPQLFLVLLLVMAVVAVMVSVHNVYLLGSTYRACRFVGFAVVLWLLSPWFGRRDLMLLRSHLAVMRGVLATVLLATAISPGLAFSFEGRLSDTLWPIPPTQVAHYAAMLLGITVVLWLCRVVPGRTALATVAIAGAMLLLTHTRTALLASVLGLICSGGSLFFRQARVRRFAGIAIGAVVLGVSLFASEVSAWILRGQSTQDATELTGRTKVWAQIADLHRSPLHTIFGDGISNMSFNGLPIDSSWMSTYLDEGWFGIAMQAGILLLLIGLAVAQEPGPRRAVALFILTYCAVASATETGLGGPSPYFLDLAVAAALLAPPLPLRQPLRQPLRAGQR